MSLPSIEKPDLDPVKDYAEAVTAGKVVAGPYVREACARHIRDWVTQEQQGLEWKLDMALRAIRFFPGLLKLEDGRPFVLQPFQEFIVGSLFGWYTTEGNRRFRTGYVEIAKGSGKSPLAAGIGLYGLVADGEPSPEIYSAAVTQDQAKIVFKDAKRMVESNKELGDLIHSQVSDLTIPSDYATFRPVSSEHRGLDGKRVHIALVDELHEHPTHTVVQKMRAGTKNRNNALIFEITNAGYDRTSVCWDHHEKSVGVLNGTLLDPGWFAYVASLDRSDDWTDEKVWIKANPGLGTIQKLQYLRERVREALTMPSTENEVKRFNFCVWTEQKERWLDLAKWDACSTPADPGPSMPLFMGLDMASTQDLTACVSLFGPDGDGAFDVKCKFWICEETLRASKSGRTEHDRAMLQHWADQGHITVTEGNVTDYDLVEREILDAAAHGNFTLLGHDRWNATQLITHLADALGDKRVVAVPPTISEFSAPTKELEKLIVAGKIRHGGNPVLRWMASNVAIRHGKDGYIKPDRDASRDKIDGIMALIMAISEMMAHQREHASVYEDHGVRTL